MATVGLFIDTNLLVLLTVDSNLYDAAIRKSDGAAVNFWHHRGL